MPLLGVERSTVVLLGTGVSKHLKYENHIFNTVSISVHHQVPVEATRVKVCRVCCRDKPRSERHSEYFRPIERL